MLNKLDDFPIHQTVEPIAHPATTDRNFYDRFWFNGFTVDGEFYFGIAMGLYPHLGILDCAFSIVRREGPQHAFFASRRAPLERTDMSAGPFRIENIVPMRRTRVVLEPNESGLSCDLTFSARTCALQEGRQTLWTGNRRTMDCTRFDLFGQWTGTIGTPEGAIVLEPGKALGVKDRSWGVRKIGDPDPAGAPVQRGGIAFLWAPLFWDDHVSQAIFFDDVNGRPLFREAIVAPLCDVEPDGADVEDGREERLATARHRLRYRSGTRLACGGEIDLVGHDDSVRTINLNPVLRFHMKGLGYGHPQWGHGMWQGDLAIHSESWDPGGLDLLQPENFHTQQLVRVGDGEQHGIGALEQIVLGPYAPAGFSGPIDGAP
jgi:hypothetical protein